MPLLESVKLSDVAPRKLAPDVSRFRQRLVKRIEIQLALAKAQAAGQPVQLTRKIRVRDEATGRTELKEAPLEASPWWWRDANGVVFLSIRAAGKTLELAPGKSVIEVGPIEELPKQLAVILDAARAGELDHCATPTSERQRPHTATSAGASQSSATAKKAAEKR
jgi:hypothetical protein